MTTERSDKPASKKDSIRRESLANFGKSQEIGPFLRSRPQGRPVLQSGAPINPGSGLDAAISRDSRLFGCSNPDCARAAHQHKRIIADELAWPGDFEANCIAGKRPNGIELIRYPQDYPRRIRTIRDESCVIRQHGKFLIEALAGKRARNHLFALNVAFDPQIAPRGMPVPQIGGKGRIFQMRELLPVGIGLGNQGSIDIKLQVFAI